MEVISGIGELKALRSCWMRPIGLVPTMGYLHDGHVALVRRAREESKTVVVTIFVNPTQFGPSEDFGCYPRAFERDVSILQAEAVDVVFAPSSAVMYPEGFSTWVEVEGITSRFEGAIRPGHFRGVATVCSKLFNIVDPERAYFGQKDAQQVAVIRKMVQDLNMNLDIEAVPTVREADGLAMSSRNAYLNGPERAAAAVLFRALSAVQEMYRAGCRDMTKMSNCMRRIVGEEKLVELDYAAIVDPASFEVVNSLEHPALAIVAARVGSTRLIDNMPLHV